MAGVAFPLVVLRHERQRHPGLVGDLLGAGLVDRVVVARGERLGVAEGDLVLAEVALALGRLDHHPRARHPVADAPQHRLDARGAEHRVVDVVEVGGPQVAVVLLPRRVEGVGEQHELQLGADVGDEPARGEPVELALEDLPRRRADGRAVGPFHVAQHQRGGFVPRHHPQRREVGAEHEVAVAALPARHRVAVDRVHLDVDGEQVVARLGGVRRHLVEEVVGGAALAREPPLHVGERDEHGVDRPVLDLGGELLEREHPPAGRHQCAIPCSMSVSSSSEPASRTGPVNHLRAESRYQPPNRITAPPTVSGA